MAHNCYSHTMRRALYHLLSQQTACQLAARVTFGKVPMWLLLCCRTRHLPPARAAPAASLRGLQVLSCKSGDLFLFEDVPLLIFIIKQLLNLCKGETVKSFFNLCFFTVCFFHFGCSFSFTSEITPNLPKVFVKTLKN